MPTHYLYKSGNNYYIRRSVDGNFVYTDVTNIITIPPSGSGWCTQYRDELYFKYTIPDNITYCITGAPYVNNNSAINLNSMAVMSVLGEKPACDFITSPGHLTASGSVPLCITTYDPPIAMPNGNNASLKIYNGIRISGSPGDQIKVGDDTELTIGATGVGVSGLLYSIVYAETNPSPVTSGQTGIYYLNCGSYLDRNECFGSVECCEGYYNTSSIGGGGLCYCSPFNLINPTISGDGIWLSQNQPTPSPPAPQPSNPTSPIFTTESDGLKITFTRNSADFNDGRWKTSVPIHMWGGSMVNTGLCSFEDCCVTGVKATISRAGGDAGLESAGQIFLSNNSDPYDAGVTYIGGSTDYLNPGDSGVAYVKTSGTYFQCGLHYNGQPANCYISFGKTLSVDNGTNGTTVSFKLHSIEFLTATGSL